MINLMKAKKQRKHIIFLRFLISYIFVLIIPILFLSYAYSKAMDLIENNAINSENFMIRQCQDVIDNYLEAVDTSVYVLSVNQTLQKIVNMPQPEFGSDKVYQLVKVVDNMKYNNISGALNSSTYIFLRKTDVVIDSNYANYNIKNFYENFFKYDNLTYDQWYNYIFSGKHYGSIMPSQKITLKSTGQTVSSVNAISYIQTIPMGAIVVLIDSSQVKQLLNDLAISENSFSFIMDSDKNLIVQTENADTTELINDENLSFDKSLQYKKINGQDTIIFLHKSDYNNWIYASAIPIRDLMGDVNFMKQTVLISIAVILILGGMISFFISKREAKPINDIMFSLSNIFPSPKNYKDEYSLIKENILNLIKRNDAIRVSMKNQQEALKGVFLEQLLYGTISDLQEIKKALNYLGLTLKGQYFAALVISINQNAEAKVMDTSTYLDKNITKIIADNVLEISLSNSGCTYLMEPKLLAVVLSFPHSNKSACEDEIKNYVHAINNEMARTNNVVDLKFGIGNIYNNLLDISFSFSEAKIAVNHIDTVDIKDSTVWYSDLPVYNRKYYYPIDLEIILINTVKAGKKNELKRMLTQIYKENFKNRTLTYAVQLSFFYEIKATLSKIKNELDFQSGIESVDMMNVRDIPVEDLWQKFADSFIHLCDIIDANKKSHNEKMLEDILDYLMNNYSDPDISLYGLSSKFKISMSYLSQFFKEQTGQRFSDFLEKRRISQACKLLSETSQTIEDISKQVGYNNVYSFRRAFKRSIGQLPNEYRSYI